MNHIAARVIGHSLCSSLRFILSVASHLNLLFVVLELIFTWYTTTFHGLVILKFSVVKDLNCRSTLIVILQRLMWASTIGWLTNENVKIMKQSIIRIPGKNKFNTRKENVLSWLATDMKFIHVRCPITHHCRS